MSRQNARTVLTVLSRFVTLLFAFLAFFAFIEAQNILDGSTDIDSFQYAGDNKFMVPLVLCFPDQIDIDDFSSGTIKCQEMDFLINACSASLIFAAVASISYVLIDVLARNNRGPFNMSAAAGMGIFLFFILMMTGITTGALVEQNQIWVDVYQATLDASSATSNYTAEAYGNLMLLMATAGLAFTASVLNVIDLMVARCCAPADATGSSNSTSPNDAMMQEMPERTKELKPSKFSSAFSKSKTSRKAESETSAPPATTEPTIEYGSGEGHSPHDKPSWLG